MEVAKIRFSLLDNAMDSIERAIELLAWNDELREESRLKQAIMLTAHACELLLKERLRRVHPSLIWEDVEKYPSIESRTVGTEKALTRLERIGNLVLTDQDKRTIRSLRNTRNAIEHFTWSTTRSEADVIIGQGLSFALHFANEYLGSDISYRFKDDDTWDQLLKKNQQFANVHGERIENAMRGTGLLVEACSFCHAIARDTTTGSCSLCGHWKAGIVGEEIPF